MDLLIVGLGNPGKSYQNTRHNLGWIVTDLLAEKWNAKFRVTGQALAAKVTTSSNNLLLVKPTTFMNNSGTAIIQFLQKYKLNPENVLVVCDDFSLPLGSIRIRKKGSAGGHNGLQSIIDTLHTQDFPRLRLGIGPVPEYLDSKDFVLTTFRKPEKESVEKMVTDAADAVVCLLEYGIDKSMSNYNSSASE